MLYIRLWRICRNGVVTFLLTTSKFCIISHIAYQPLVLTGAYCLFAGADWDAVSYCNAPFRNFGSLGFTVLIINPKLDHNHAGPLRLKCQATEPSTKIKEKRKHDISTNVIMIVFSCVTLSRNMIRIPAPFNSFVERVLKGVLSFHIISSLQTCNYDMRNNNSNTSENIVQNNDCNIVFAVYVKMFGSWRPNNQRQTSCSTASK